MIGWGPEDLTSYMQALGYKADERGVCYGYSHMGVQAILSRGMKDFDQRIELMKQDHEVVKILKVEEQSLSEKEKEESILRSAEVRGKQGITPFLDGVELYFQSPLYPELFEPGKAPMVQDALATAPLVMSTEIRDQGGLEQCSNFSGIYNNTELTQFFDSFKGALTSSNPPNTEPIAMSLQNDQHSIAVGFDPSLDPQKGQWVVIDSDNMPTQYLKNPQEVAAAVQNSFQAPVSAFFSTYMYTTNQNKEHFDKIVGTWQGQPDWTALHQVNKASEGTTDLHLSSWLRALVGERRLESVRELLKNPEIDPNSMTFVGLTPLTSAVVHKQYDIAKELLKHPKIDPDKATGNEEKYTPLQAAVILQDTELVKLLLVHGANPNCTAGDRNPPLHEAVLQNNPEIVALLLKYGAKPDMENSDGKSVRTIAEENQNSAIVSLLDKHNAISKALDNKDLDSLKELLKKEVDSKQADQKRATVLHLAVQAGYVKVAKELINLEHPDINVKAADARGMTPLHLAASNGELSLVEKLLKKGADPDARGPMGTTPRELGRDNEAIEAAFEKQDKKAAKQKEKSKQGGLYEGSDITQRLASATSQLSSKDSSTAAVSSSTFVRSPTSLVSHRGATDSSISAKPTLRELARNSGSTTSIINNNNLPTTPGQPTPDDKERSIKTPRNQ